ncbi:glutaredoxin-like protein NrdH [Cellulosimicrobium cellulans]|nr:glutaredoxin-like protein NrdH [Cellulosimicrobium cellulans]
MRRDLLGLDKNGIEYRVVDVTQGAAALERELGYPQVLVVVAGDDHWSGFRPNRVNALIN